MSQSNSLQFVFISVFSLVQTEDLVERIRLTFKKRLEDNIWMDDETRKRAVEKIDALKYKVGYPDFVKNSTLLDKYYEKVTANC